MVSGKLFWCVVFFFNICIGIYSSFIRTIMKYLYYELHCNRIQDYLVSEQYAMILLTLATSEEVSKLSREMYCWHGMKSFLRM